MKRRLSDPNKTIDRTLTNEGKENTIPPAGNHKKARKALLNSWGTSTPYSALPQPHHAEAIAAAAAAAQKVPDMYIIETPVCTFFHYIYL